MCALVAVYIAIGMKWYSRIQKYCFWIGIVALVIVFAFLLFGSHASFRSGLEEQAPALFGADANVYDATLAAGEEAGAVSPLWGGTLGAIFLAIPYLVFFNLWPNWGATLYGEVRGATDFKRNFWGMGWALIVTTDPGRRLFPADQQDDHLGLLHEGQRRLVELCLGLHRADAAAAHLALSRPCWPSS